MQTKDLFLFANQAWNFFSCFPLFFSSCDIGCRYTGRESTLVLYAFALCYGARREAVLPMTISRFPKILLNL